jgi:hypothetical protein
MTVGRVHPFACIQRVSNSARFCSAATPSMPAEEVSFDASNWHSTSSRPRSLSRPRSELSPPGRTQVVAQPATQAATAKTPIIVRSRSITDVKGGHCPHRPRRNRWDGQTAWIFYLVERRQCSCCTVRRDRTHREIPTSGGFPARTCRRSPGAPIHT